VLSVLSVVKSGARLRETVVSTDGLRAWAGHAPREAIGDTISAMVRISLVVFAFGLTLVPESAALAQAQDPREVEARKDCLTGKYEAGAALLAELFAETGNTNFVYNQARCYEQNAKPDEAIQHFREYLRIAGKLSADEKADVERHIAECRAMKAEQEQQQRGAAPLAPAILPTPVAPSAPLLPVSPSLPQAAPTTETGGSSPHAGVAVTTESSPEGGGSKLRTWGIVTGSVGVAAVGAGVAFGLLTGSTKQQVESDVRNGFFDHDKDANGRLYETLQWVGYGVGAAAIAAGAIMYFVGHSAREGARSVALVPAVGPGQGGLLLRGGF